VEAELNLVTAEEKELNPVGMGRKEPEPLPDPKYVRSILLAVVLDNTIRFVCAMCHTVCYPVSDNSRPMQVTLITYCKLDLKLCFLGFRSVLLWTFSVHLTDISIVTHV